MTISHVHYLLTDCDTINITYTLVAIKSLAKLWLLSSPNILAFEFTKHFGGCSTFMRTIYHGATYSQACKLLQHDSNS